MHTISPYEANRRYADVILSFHLQVHGSDVVGNMYAPGDLTDFLINFVNHLDPNGKTGSALAWPQYTPDSPQLMTLLDGDTPQAISEDTYRQEAIAFLQKLSLEYLL